MTEPRISLVHIHETIGLELTKQAAPAWTKMLSSLSSGAVDRLRTNLPATMARQVGKAELGRGAEGRVMNAFVGQHGPAAVKVFNDMPAVTPAGASPELGRISGGSSGLKGLLGGRPISERVDIMKQNPSIFPKVLGEHPRGYFVEKLKPIVSEEVEGVANRVPSLDTRANIQHTVRELRATQTNQNIRKALLDSQSELPWWKKLLGGQSEAQANPMAFARQQSIYNDFQEQTEALKNKIKELMSIRGRGLAAASNPINQLNKRMQEIPTAGHHPIESRRIQIPYNNEPRFIQDFGLQPVPGLNHHNIMQAADGRAVISDPIIAKMPY